PASSLFKDGLNFAGIRLKCPASAHGFTALWSKPRYHRAEKISWHSSTPPHVEYRESNMRATTALPTSPRSLPPGRLCNKRAGFLEGFVPGDKRPGNVGESRDILRGGPEVLS